mmetsp:Transcript_7061/g.10560  ORF Transcript_7061/g.10560 Transcript_7061/m.10560 type:complete len:243 (+) Transcript_7061:103-831(+)
MNPNESTESTGKSRRALRTKKRRRIQSENRPEINISSLDQFPFRSPSLLLEDAQIVCNQLGYIPTNLVDIGSRDTETNVPQTIVLYALNKNDSINGRYSKGLWQPFPTMIWMSCPILKSKISKLEGEGYISEFQERLVNESGDPSPTSTSSPSYLRQMETAHRLYANERWDRLTDEDKAIVERNGWSDSLGSEVGVAGIRDFSSVKCLHCHYAHFLARPDHGNIIGAWTDSVLKSQENTETS